MNLARRFSLNNIDFKLIEKTDHIGGKIYSEICDDFILDYGFQIYLDNYKFSKKVLDLNNLNLKKFYSGGILIHDNNLKLYSNPLFDFFAKNNNIWKEIIPLAAIFVNSLFDNKSGKSTKNWIDNDFNTSQSFKLFAKSFLRGVLLDKDLKIDKSIALDYLKLFSLGHATIPEYGMYEIPKQIYSKIDNKNQVIFNEEVNLIENNKIITNEGNEYLANNIIIATDLKSINNIFKLGIEDVGREVTNLYFKTDEKFLDFPGIYLNGNKNDIINHFCMPNLISNKYSPIGKNLLSVSLFNSKLNQKEIIQQVKRELKGVFGSVTDTLELIKIDSYFNDCFLPQDINVKNMINNNNNNIYYCGGYVSNSSTEAAMKSSEKLADYLLRN